LHLLQNAVTALANNREKENGNRIVKRAGIRIVAWGAHYATRVLTSVPIALSPNATDSSSTLEMPTLAQIHAFIITIPAIITASTAITTNDTAITTNTTAIITTTTAITVTGHAPVAIVNDGHFHPMLVPLVHKLPHM
jgi:hypothetical protein